MTDHYDTLGVPRDADADAIKRAYRQRAAKAHPDRKGGSHEVMAHLNRALEVLTDAEKRERYDRTGSDSAQPSIDDIARESLVGMISQFLDAEVDIAGDIVERFREAVRLKRAESVASIATAERRIRHLEKHKKRIKGPVLYSELVENKIRKQRLASALESERMKVHDRVLELLNEFADLQPGQSILHTFATGSGRFTSAFTSGGT